VRRIWPAVYPAGYAVSYVLLSFAAFPTPTIDLARPLGVVLLATPALVVLLAGPLRGAHRSALLVSTMIVLGSAPFLLVPVLTAILVVLIVQLARGRWTWARLRQLDAETASRGATVFSVAFALVAILTAMPTMAGGWYARSEAPSVARGPNQPNIYLILLDGYPRGDTLAEVYGYDNTGFESSLGALGFRVAPASRSNYPHTWLTLTSMLNGSYLDAIDALTPPPLSAPDQYRLLMNAISTAAMPGVLRMHGYAVEDIPSPFHAVSLTAADDYLDSGQATAFEYSLLVHSQLSIIASIAPDFLMSQQRDRFQATLSRLARGMEAVDGRPVFVFAHLLSPPHAPLVYGRDGEALPPPECFPGGCSLWEFPAAAWDHLGDEIHYANGEVLKAMEGLVDRDPEAVVILMSDHGSRRDPAHLDEFFHTFFAARVPGRNPFPDDVSPVNVLRLVISAVTDERLDPLPYRAWSFADNERPLELTPFGPSP
jgi:hypothetical protein